MTDPGCVAYELAEQRAAAGAEAIMTALIAAIESGAELRADDWRDSAHGAAHCLDEIAKRPDVHPDDRDNARQAIGDLLGLFLGAEEVDAIYVRAADTTSEAQLRGGRDA
jgi:hypothetical protein